MNFTSKASLKLTLAPEITPKYTPTEFSKMCDNASLSFSKSEDDICLGFSMEIEHRPTVEFSVVCYDPSVHAIDVVESLEREFLRTDILKREISYERKQEEKDCVSHV